MIGNSNIVVLGGRESGTGAALLARAKGHSVFVSDAKELKSTYKYQLQAAKIPFEEGKHSEDKILQANEIIKSPGIPFNTPLVQKAIKKGIPVIDEIEFAFRYTKAKIIAITGTNGKTTTSLLIYHILKTTRLNVCLAGNIGHSLSMQLVKASYDYIVLEISSFQIEGLKKFKPKVAVILNITPDHLDRYGNEIGNYMNTKFGLLKNMSLSDVFIYSDDDKLIKDGIKKHTPLTRHVPFSLTKPKLDRALYYENQMYFDLNLTEEHLFKIPVAELPIRGKHNIQNAMAAILACATVQTNTEYIKKAISTFKNADHRIEFIKEIDGVSYYNDSKATNVESTFYALESFKEKVIWIAGGKDKGNNYAIIEPLVSEKVKALICLGIDNQKLKNAFSETVPHIKESQDIREAVKMTKEVASNGDVVLLSPACSSFDLFTDYEDRGNQFKNAVKALS